MIGEAALTLARGEADVGGGSWTPASALGDALRVRLEAHAGMTFTVV
jgi:saccharopine dehydrogenase (NAD+, L-glutamate forming)